MAFAEPLPSVSEASASSSSIRPSTSTSANGADGSSSSTFSAESFFATQDPPPRLAQLLSKVTEFVAVQARRGRRVALVTSGGTTVPLEHNVVRFLDNFSAGTRGAASAEQFLRTGRYAVIFLHRQHSLQPFSRHYSHSTNPFLDLLQVVSPSTTEDDDEQEAAEGQTSEDGQGASKEEGAVLFPDLSTTIHRQHKLCSGSSSQTPNGVASRKSRNGTEIQVKASERSAMLAILDAYQLVRTQDLLHSIPFVTVHEYLFLLRGIAQIMNGHPASKEGESVGRRGLYYLAAAVSDFFLPQQKMSQHKIQSGKGSLVIEMDQVPKILRSLVQEWSADGFTVSFKLETDRTLIVPKARTALERYGHQVVIGNDLATRKHEVVFVSGTAEEEWVTLPEAQLEAGVEIEQEIIKRLVKMHDAHIGQEAKADAARARP